MNARKLRACLLLTGVILVPAAHAGQCKSLEQPACEAESACTWVGSYTRSDGREVSGYCRNAPRKTGASSSGSTSAAEAGSNG